MRIRNPSDDTDTLIDVYYVLLGDIIHMDEMLEDAQKHCRKFGKEFDPNNLILRFEEEYMSDDDPTYMITVFYRDVKGKES